MNKTVTPKHFWW